MQKIGYVLRSRKFWAGMIGLAVALGVLDWNDEAQAVWVAAIAGGVVAAYQLAVAIEDGLRALGQGATKAERGWDDAE